MNLTDPTYKQWLTELKSKIRSVQIKAAIAVNSSLIQFYWGLGKMINEKQTAWGSKFLENLSNDLQEEFLEMNGLSARNGASCRQFYQFYNSTNLQKVVGNFSSQAVNQWENIENEFKNLGK